MSDLTCPSEIRCFYPSFGVKSFRYAAAVLWNIFPNEFRRVIIIDNLNH